MARLVTLTVRGGWVAAAGLFALGCFSTTLRAADAVPMPTQGQPIFPSVAKPTPAKTPAAPSATTNAAPVTAAQTPVKLKLPSPGAGEVNVPTPDELGMREKLEQLAKLSDEEIHTQLQQWPEFGKMSLRDQGQMLMRIQDFRDFRARVAAQKAHDMGLLTLSPDQKLLFEKEYWDKRLRMDRDLVKQLGPIFNARQQKMEDELFREFSMSAGPIALGVKPPVPAPTNKPPQIATTNSVTTVKAPGALAQPVAQGQK